ncbi:MAG TPA: DUF2059 domain-containing protein [Pyrinomonadaceae bacterium]|nr:DUF2059 domain-containing protein [Pyrinomonadaceae bacterium]
MKKITLLIAVVMLFAFQTIKAQNEISAEKRQAIKDLIALINKDNNSEELFRVLMTQMEESNAEIIKTILDERTDLTQAERKDLEKQLVDNYKNQSKVFQDKLMQKLDYNAMTEEIMTTVYDKYYTLEEINDLIVFYKSPTGQKTLKTMQPLMIDTLKLTQEKLGPKILSVIQEIRDEQKREIAKKAEEIMPRKRKTNNK